MIPAQDVSAEAWSQFLSAQLDNPVVVTFGHARRQVVQSKGYWKDPSGAPIAIRLARFFTGAPPEVQSALVTWLLSSRKRGRRSAKTLAASRLLDEFIDSSLKALPPKKPRTPSAANSNPIGQAHDLAPLAEGLRSEFEADAFDLRGLPTITWGRRGLSRAKRSLQLGCYTEDSHAIRVHAVLDQPRVPIFFVRFVLFHELLHAVRSIAADVPDASPALRARRLHHDRTFRERESRYCDFAAAQQWQRDNVGKLLRSARTGSEFKPKHAILPSLFGA